MGLRLTGPPPSIENRAVGKKVNRAAPLPAMLEAGGDFENVD
jgi:hypothetical protein